MTAKEKQICKCYDNLFKAICLQAKHDYCDSYHKIAKIKKKMEDPLMSEMDRKSWQKVVDKYAKDMVEIEQFYITVGFKPSLIEKLRKIATKRTAVKKTVK